MTYKPVRSCGQLPLLYRGLFVSCDTTRRPGPNVPLEVAGWPRAAATGLSTCKDQNNSCNTNHYGWWDASSEFPCWGAPLCMVSLRWPDRVHLLVYGPEPCRWKGERAT